MKKGFTLLELVVVIIILGILAALGLTQYAKMVEKGRTAEAKTVLGTLRTAEAAYNLEKGTYLAFTGTELPVSAPGACVATHYFRYSCDAAGLCTATRCTVGGKDPQGATAYVIDLNTAAGVWTGTAGYF